MKKLTTALLTLFLLSALPAYAEQPVPSGQGMMMSPGMGPGMGPGMRRGPPADCSKAPDPANCQAMQSAHETCKQYQGMAHRECLEDKMPAPDCTKSPRPDECRKHQEAHVACKDKPYGAERHNCVMDKMGIKSR